MPRDSKSDRGLMEYVRPITEPQQKDDSLDELIEELRSTLDRLEKASRWERVREALFAEFLAEKLREGVATPKRPLRVRVPYKPLFAEPIVDLSDGQRE